MVVRRKAKRALLRFTDTTIKDLKNDEDEMLRGALTTPMVTQRD